ncbi:MAG: hypothetical protein GY740_15190 [Gammaproteobacteria bacterium]|nr:hypothetical protein [Gammaproteobacteria bacterium]
MSKLFPTVPLSQIAEISMGQSPDSSTVKELGAAGLPFLQGNAEFGEKHPSPKYSCIRPPRIGGAGATLISVRAPVGQTNIADRDYCIGRGLAAVKSRQYGPVLCRSIMAQHAGALKKVSQGTTFEAIGRDDLFSLLIPQIPPTEAAIIESILDTLDTQIQKSEALIAKLEKIKEGLLHDLLTRGIDQNGQLRPTPDQAPELYKESALGLIPKEWAIRSIADAGVKLIDGDRGANYPSEQDFSTGSGHCVFLSARNVTRSGFRFDACQFISKDKDRILGTGKLIRDDVVVTTRGTVGNFAHYSRDIAFEHIRINSGMLILRITESNLLSEFLYLSLKEHLFDRENSRKGSGSAQPQLPARDFQSFSLVIPSQSEQRKIIELSSLENQTIEAEIREFQKLLSLKSALMDDLLTGQVRVTPLLKDEV